MEQGNALILGRDLVSARRDPHGRRWTTSAGVKEGMLSEAWNAEDEQSASASLRLARVPGVIVIGTANSGACQISRLQSLLFCTTFILAKSLHNPSLRSILMFGDDGISGRKTNPDSRSR
jgi:hypothetical protein